MLRPFYLYMMTRFSFLASITALALGAVAPSEAAGADLEKPNILFIFADDQCFETIHSLGNAEIETPNLDRLVSGGTTFTHAYNMGSWSGAVCVASRNMLNSGQFLWHAEKEAKTRQAKGQMWSQLMGAAGYDTYFTGKWHVEADATKIFKVARHVRGGMPDQTPEGYNRPIEGQPDPWSPSDPQFGGFWKGGKHWSEVVGDDAVDYLGMAKKSENPFFMYIAFNAPHDPRQSPQEFVDKYPLDKISIPENYMDEYPYKDAIGCGKNLRDEKLAPFPRTHHAVKVNRQEYYAIITHMDVQIGRILDQLEASGMADKTYIFFSADHGLAVGQHGLMGKQNLFEHSVRIPMIVNGPGVAKNQKNPTPVYLQDIMATSLELGGAERPDHVQFKSMLPLLSDQGEAKRPYDAIYGAYLGVQRSVQKDGLKLILYPKVPVALLYDLNKDPKEMRNLAENPEYKPKMKALFAEFMELQKEMGDQMDLTATFPELK